LDFRHLLEFYSNETNPENSDLHDNFKFEEAWNVRKIFPKKQNKNNKNKSFFKELLLFLSIDSNLFAKRN
jgi:hypothetical protein